MKNEHRWSPSKYECVNGTWRGSRDPRHVGLSSRLISDMTAVAYHRAIQSFATGRLVDLGCGSVPLYQMYRPHVEEITCIDWPHSHYDLQFADYFMDLSKSLDLTSEYYDTIVSSDVLEHVAEVDVIWSEMTRVCKPGGHIIIGTPFLYPLHDAPYDYWRYTSYNLRRCCEKHGLEVVDLAAYGGVAEVIADLTLKQFANKPWICTSMDRLFRILLRLKPVRAHSDDSKKAFPLGYCLVARKTG